MNTLIEFQQVCKYYYMGDTTVTAANHISFQIYKGEFVAIVGSSGSGKSTCMNIIGCLDVPSEGTYLLSGQDVGQMNKNQLAEIRNELLGFIFQQYNLLPKLNLVENVEVPLMYAGVPKGERRERALVALEQVGLGNKWRHKPMELSGGQQQRVSIARALVGRPSVILADEPTGALDSRTGREVLAMLQDIHRQGNTVVLITHDNSIAVQAQRIIRLEDGKVVYDGPSDAPEAVVTPRIAGGEEGEERMSILESLELALKNIVSSKVRTLLTMLGIIIGVAAVIVIVGLGNGLEGYVTESFSDMGTNTLTVTVMSRGSTRSLDVEDMYDIVEENSEYLDLCSPTVTMAGYVKIGSETVDTTTSTGVSEDYLDIARLTIAQGRNLQYSDMSTRAKVCVIGAYLNQAYFGGNAVGQTLRVGGQSLEIVGVLAQQDDELEEGGSDDCLYLPYTTAERITGETSTYTITMKDENYIDESVAALEASLYAVFASDDYYTVTSMSEMLETMTSMINLLVGVLAGIAAISLVVGGIGIMNIMLVSVTERTREIGIRKSLGAKERYIMQQFVIEAAATSALGGIIGILLGDGLSILATQVVERLMEESLTISPTLAAVALAFGISVGIGIFFGYLPAKKAAQLNPIDALHYD